MFLPSKAKQFFRKALRSVIGERNLARIDFKRGVRLKSSWEGVFNQQLGRKQIFDDINEHFGIETIVETGTFRGTTTEYFSKASAMQVFSIEFDSYNAGYAQARLASYQNVEVINLDSRSGLKYLIEEKKLEPSQNTFIYLDAHWNRDLPLRDELRIVFEFWKDNLVVMVDDFCVPDDRGYAFDDYGESGSLAISHIQDIIHNFNIGVYFPKMNSSEETGSKRGCVVLAPNTIKSRSLFSEIESLRGFPIEKLDRVQV